MRAYAVDPTQDHSECMAEFAAAGIYVLTPLSGSKSEVIDGEVPEWNYGLYQRYTAVVDAFQNYTNVLGFFAGNEVANTSQTSNALAFVKAAVRDTKAYIKQKGYREIPVGYATNDYEEINDQLADYLNCGDANDIADFQGLNEYGWCGDSNLEESGYDQLISQYRNYSVPVFLSEYGCDEPSPRNFTEVQAIYGSSMTGVFSGGVVYQYYADDADYGLVTVLENSVSKSPDFTALSSQIAKISPSSTNSAQYSVTNSVQQACPTVGPSWSAAPTLPPTPYQRLCTCMMQSLGCVANATASSSDNSDSVSAVCDLDMTACLGVSTNATTGDYGAFTVCNQTEQISWILNQYYESQNHDASACSKVGGILQSSVTGAAVATDCSIMLQQAGAAGTGTITSTPSPPATVTSGVSGYTGSGGNGTSSPNNGASTLSGGAIAGIVIGVIALFAAVGGIGAFLIWQHRKAKRKMIKQVPEPDPVLKPELADNQVPAHERRPLIDGQEVKPEMGCNIGPYELQSINYFEPAELDAEHGVSEAIPEEQEEKEKP